MELEHCPFCNSASVFVMEHEDMVCDQPHYFVWCSDCYAQGPGAEALTHEDAKDLAAERWNKRNFPSLSSETNLNALDFESTGGNILTGKIKIFGVK